MVMWIKPLTIRYHIHTIHLSIWLTNKLTFFPLVFFLVCFSFDHHVIIIYETDQQGKRIQKMLFFHFLFGEKKLFQICFKKMLFFQCYDHNIFADWKRKKLRKIISLIILVVDASNNNYFQHKPKHTHEIRQFQNVNFK